MALLLLGAFATGSTVTALYHYLTGDAVEVTPPASTPTPLQESILVTASQLKSTPLACSRSLITTTPTDSFDAELRDALAKRRMKLA